MPQRSRRAFLLGTLALGSSLRAEPAGATLLRGLPLPALVQRSQRVAVLEPLESVCRYAEIAGRRSIVTDTRVIIHESWRGSTADKELTLRTLGGRLDGVGELVHGQPLLELGVRDVAFLQLGRSGDVWWTTGMAQGHYPLSDLTDEARLLPNRQLPALLHPETSAVEQLVGRRRLEARNLVRLAQRAGQP
jgi:hypothetical protein